MKKIYLSLLTLLLFSVQKIIAQAPVFELGVKITSEFTAGKNDGSGFGLQAIYKFTKHSGLETGISYKINPKKYLAFQAPTPVSLPFFSSLAKNERTILIPLAYRFESRLINISAGTGLNFLINKNKLEHISTADKTDWEKNSMEILTAASISKSFRLNKTMIAEPEIKYCSYSASGGSGFQLNLSFRKRFL
jgi:hypothetical protein